MNLIQKTILICIAFSPFLVFSLNSEVVIPEVEEPTYEYTIAGFKQYATVQVTNRWDSEQVNAFKQIIHKESSWRVNDAHYADGKSTAFGFGGFLNATWETVGCEKTTDQFKQIDCTIEYIAQRYETPVNALAFHNRNGWY